MDVVSVVLGIESSNFDQAIRVYAGESGFDFAGVDCVLQGGVRARFREGFSYYTGLSPARIPGTGLRRRFLVLNAVTDSYELLFSDNNFTSSDAADVLALIDSVVPGSSEPSNTFDAWQMDTTLPESQAMPLDDADGDGLSNLLEFALGTPGLEKDATPVATSVGAADTLSISFTERIDVSGIETQLEISNDLRDWQPLEPSFDSWPREPIDDVIQRVLVTLPATMDRSFIRLRTSLSP